MIFIYLFTLKSLIFAQIYPFMYKHNHIFYSIFISILLLCCTLTAEAQRPEPTLTYFSKEDNTSKTVGEGETVESEAPLQIACKANMQSEEGVTYRYEWRIFKTSQGFNSPSIIRYEPDFDYEFTESDTYGVALTVTCSDGVGPDYDIDDIRPFTIKILESELSCPDGFSPNGDGHNDVYHITYKSVTSFQAVIFNRWGQKLKVLDLSNVEEGWDGTYNGRKIKDGVYFINLNAKGADGKEYKIKKAINVLKGYRDEDETDGRN